MKELRTENDVRKLIEEYGYEDVLIFSNPDYASAFIGISEDNRAVYDFGLMVEHLCLSDNIDESEAVEFIEFNTIRSLPYYENAPIIVYPLN